MDNRKNLNYFTTEDSVTLYWDKPELASTTVRYQVYVDGRLVASPLKTHYTVEHLAPDKEYSISVTGAWEADLAWAAFPTVQVRTLKKKYRIDISKAPYCAAGDGKTLNTKPIQQAITDCGREQVVYIPAGVFMTGALKLHSDMELYLEDGAILQGTQNLEDYLPRINSRFEGTELGCYSSVLNMGELSHSSGYNCGNVVIRGKGTIASGGRVLAERIIENEREALNDYLMELGQKVLECENENTIPGRVRPRLINISNSQNVILSGLTFRDGASWNVHMIYSDHIITHDCTFHSEGVWNGDGWDPDSSSNCAIFGCRFYTGDDSIAIKSGKNPQGNEINRPCEHIKIFDCVSAFGHGIAIGSEMSGGINDVSIWDCDLIGSRYGIEVKATAKRGGYVRNISVRDCTIPRVMVHSVAYNDDGIGAGVLPVLEHYRFENLYITGCYINNQREKQPCTPLELSGFDDPGHYLRDVVFKHIQLKDNQYNSGENQTIVMSYCENISFIDISYAPSEEQ